jgi:hypothetical protein
MIKLSWVGGRQVAFASVAVSSLGETRAPLGQGCLFSAGFLARQSERHWTTRA